MGSKFEVRRSRFRRPLENERSKFEVRRFDAPLLFNVQFRDSAITQNHAEAKTMAITRFEDIHAWQAARDLCGIVYGLTRGDKFSRDFALVDQVRRAAVSIMANIAEGFDSRSNSEFIQFLYYALRSASELQSHFYVALDQNYLTQAEFGEIFERTGKTKSLIFPFIQYLRTHDRP